MVLPITTVSTLRGTSKLLNVLPFPSTSLSETAATGVGELGVVMSIICTPSS